MPGADMPIPPNLTPQQINEVMQKFRRMQEQNVRPDDPEYIQTHGLLLSIQKNYAIQKQRQIHQQQQQHRQAQMNAQFQRQQQQQQQQQQSGLGQSDTPASVAVSEGMSIYLNLHLNYLLTNCRVFFQTAKTPYKHRLI